MLCFLKDANKWEDFNSSNQVVCIVLFFHSAKFRRKIGRVEVWGRRSIPLSLCLDFLSEFMLKWCGLGVLDPTETTDANLRFDGDALLFSRGHMRNERLSTAKARRHFDQETL